MGISYIKPSEVDSTLRKIIYDPRLPGGHIDTEFVHETSIGGAEGMRDELIGEAESESSYQGPFDDTVCC